MMQPLPLVLILVALSALLLWDFLARVEAGDPEIELMSRRDLYALHVLRIVESPDYRFHSRRSRQYRQFLFKSFAAKLQQDVRDLALLPSSLWALALRTLFQAGYWSLWLKAQVWTGRRDLRVLLGIELLLIRTLANGSHRRS